MDVTITFKNLEHTPSLDEKIREKSEKLKRYFKGKTHINWTCWVDDHHHYSEVHVRGKGLEAHASAEADTLYKTFDQVIKKLEKQLGKKHDSVKDKIHHKHDGEVEFAES